LSSSLKRPCVVVAGWVMVDFVSPKLAVIGVFALFFVVVFCLPSSYVLCTQCCQFLWIVHS
jgi:hypothetical protein